MPRTYTHGYNLTFSCALSKADYIDICRKVSERLNTLHGIKDEESLIRIMPEAVGGGGWVFYGGPNNIYDDGDSWKTMRHGIGPTLGITKFDWPWITEYVEEEWSASTEVFIPGGYVATTTLKAFKGAPVWTQDELKIFATVFADFGIKTSGRLPGKARLTSKD